MRRVKRTRQTTGRNAWPGRVATTLLLAMPAAAAVADEPLTNIQLPPISIGAGLRTSFTHTSGDGSTSKANDFTLDSVRLYINGSVTPQIKFTFNTEYTGSPPSGTNSLQVMDAIGRFEYSDTLNIWAGRFLPPSDRANLYGPYYANNWKVYTDGVQDGYPSVAVGRDNGAAYWGQFGILKVSAGAFDIPETTAPAKNQNQVVAAGRLQLDFWDPEPGYYLNGTYYGDKDILAVGAAAQGRADKHAFSFDVLAEKKLPDAGVVTFESEYARYNKFGGYGGFDGSYSDSKGWYGLVAYLFPEPIGMGKFQILGKYGRVTFDQSALRTNVSQYEQRTSEVDLNYIIKSFNARVSLFYKRASFDSGLPTNNQVGLGLQLQI